MSSVHVTELWIYPIKGCGGVSVSELELTPRGPKWDRHWMIIDENGRFTSQRQHSQMCLLALEFNSAGDFTLSIPGQGDFVLGASSQGYSDARSGARGDRPVISAQVWDCEVQVVETDTKISQALSLFLGTPVRLVEMAPGHSRLIKEKYGSGEIQFADSLQLLVISEESLAELNRRLENPVPMNRFRPNVVVKGVDEPHGEDSWQQVKVGDVTFKAPKLCVRCVVTTVDQATGEKSPEPLATLAKYRRGEKGILFGQHLVPEGLGGIHVGDEVL